VKTYRALVTGSRDWPSSPTVWAALNEVRAGALLAGHRLTVVHGSCPRGADAHAAAWCKTVYCFDATVTEEKHPANWQLNGKRAGFIRNQLMVNLGADVCLAFIKDGSRGASHTAGLAEAAGIETRRFTA
jgi:hypothetical protein